jgi:hypothetical protein
MEGKAMKPFLSLNLKDDREKVDVEQVPKPATEPEESRVSSKVLNQMANRAAHKAAIRATGHSSMFSK